MREWNDWAIDIFVWTLQVLLFLMIFLYAFRYKKQAIFAMLAAVILRNYVL